MLRSSLVALGVSCSAHVALTATNLCTAVFASGRAPSSFSSTSAAPKDRAERLQTTVELMYEESLVPQSRWAPGCTFEDPAAACAGHAEIAEAFRALAALQPKPKARFLSGYTAENNTFTFTQEMQYSIAGRQVALDSVVVVRDDGDGQVVEMTELWNGAQLFRPGFVSRRLNGVLSFYATKFLL